MYLWPFTIVSLFSENKLFVFLSLFIFISFNVHLIYSFNELSILVIHEYVVRREQYPWYLFSR